MTDLLQKYFDPTLIKKARDLYSQNAGKDTAPSYTERLQALDKKIRQSWQEDEFFKQDREIHGEDKVEAMKRAVLHHDFSAFQDYSEEFYEVYSVASRFQDILRIVSYLETDNADTELPEFDKTLMKYSAVLSNLYDKYFFAWIRAMQNSSASVLLKHVLQVAPNKLTDYPNREQIFSHYTVNILPDGEDTENIGSLDKIKSIPYAEAFAEELTPIYEVFDELMVALEAIPDRTDVQHDYFEFLRQYRKALAVDRFEDLEKEWRELDIKWMKFSYPVEIVHEMEYDYGDPLRVKVMPAFSIRLLDDRYREENEDINKLRGYMVDFYKNERHGEIMEKGMFSLEHSSAGLYYLPFQSGVDLYFSFTGQSIPNRVDVRGEYGTKIYFNPESARSRQAKAKMLANKVLAVPISDADVDAIDSIVNLVSVHEFGHAIYGMKYLEGLEDRYRSRLEETRAELTVIFMLNYLLKNGVISDEEADKRLYSFALQDLRRFADYESSTLLPYIISAKGTYKTYEETGYMYIEGDKLHVNRDKTRAVLDALADKFIAMLDMIDGQDVEGMVEFYENYDVETPLVKWLAQRLMHSV